jgi:rubrerythrin
MPEFLNPFPGLTPERPLTVRELTRALRLALSAEEEAVHLYEALADATDHELVKTVLQDIANEERVHVGEFQRLLNLLLADEEQWLAEGAAEVDEMAESLEKGKGGAAEPAGQEIPTVGDLRGR